jgi:hypothetical protein
MHDMSTSQIGDNTMPLSTEYCLTRDLGSKRGKMRAEKGQKHPKIQFGFQRNDIMDNYSS